jgi:ribosomal protein L11 methyltransferase
VNNQSIESKILSTLQRSSRRITPLDLTRHLKALGEKQHQVKAGIDALLAVNAIEYTYHLGNTFLELSYNKPVRVTNGIVLKPPACTFDAMSGDIVINMKPGAAFGSGRHPTTQLCLSGLEFLLLNENSNKKKKDRNVLDIGTGSGILLIAALKMGISAGMGLDVEPCAVAEARENVLLNGLEKRIHISNRPAESIRDNFFLILANLRVPTLERLLPFFARRIIDSGYLVLSGLKAEEMATFEIKTNKTEWFEKTVWQKTRLGWGAMVLKKRPASE